MILLDRWTRRTGILLTKKAAFDYGEEGFGSRPTHYQQSEASEAVSASLCKSKQSTWTYNTDNNLQRSESTVTAV